MISKLLQFLKILILFFYVISLISFEIFNSKTSLLFWVLRLFIENNKLTNIFQSIYDHHRGKKNVYDQNDDTTPDDGRILSKILGSLLF